LLCPDKLFISSHFLNRVMIISTIIQHTLLVVLNAAFFYIKLNYKNKNNHSFSTSTYSTRFIIKQIQEEYNKWTFISFIINRYKTLILKLFFYTINHICFYQMKNKLETFLKYIYNMHYIPYIKNFLAFLSENFFQSFFENS